MKETTGIDKKLMEKDQNDRHPPNSIIKLSKSFDNGQTSKSDSNRLFPSHLSTTYSIKHKQDKQMKEPQESTRMTEIYQKHH